MGPEREWNPPFYSSEAPSGLAKPNLRKFAAKNYAGIRYPSQSDLA